MRAVVLTEKAEIALEIALQDRPEPVAYEDEVRIVVLGSYPTPLSLRGVGRKASIVFSSVYRDDREFAAALRLLARGAVNTGPLTTAVLPITRYDEAFASLRDPGHAVKIFLDPSRSEEGESDGQSHLDRAEQSGSRARG